MKRLRGPLGVVGVVGVALGLYLGGFLKGFGLGDHSPGTANTPSTQVSDEGPNTPVRTKVASQTTTGDEDVDLGSPVRPGTQMPKPETVDVIIDGDSYHFRNPQTYAIESKPVSAEEVLAKVRTATGNSDGIRVKIYRKASALPSAEARLAAVLESDGIKQTATYWHNAITE